MQKEKIIDITRCKWRVNDSKCSVVLALWLTAGSVQNVKQHVAVEQGKLLEYASSA